MSPKTQTVRHDDANEPNEKIVLRVSDLRVLTNAGDEILHGVDFALARGEILGLVGESGSGKTTAGLACMGHFREGLKFGSGSVSIWPRGMPPTSRSATSTRWPCAICADPGSRTSPRTPRSRSTRPCA